MGDLLHNCYRLEIELGVAHRLAGETTEAEARLKQVLALFSSLSTRWQLGRTLFELGELPYQQTLPRRVTISPAPYPPSRRCVRCRMRPGHGLL